MALLSRAYFLAKDEEPNIGRSVGALVRAGVPCTVLDSGSTDHTIEVARAAGAEVVPYHYRGHALAYNELTQRHARDEAVLVLDADFILDAPVLREAEALLATGVDVVLAPVDMYWEGERLEHASLYPPKPIVLRGGRAYMEAEGHTEWVRPGERVATTRAHVIHDDRKPYERMLLNQVRYARMITAPSDAGLSWRDRLRRSVPAMVVASPLYTYVVKCGWKDGRAGVVYALDRLISEAIFFRTAVAARMRAARDSADRR